MATRTISTKLAIEGESEYRAALSRINTELKTAQSSLKLVESEFKNNANTLEALKSKHEAIERVFDTQKKKVDELAKALENAKSAQETYAQKSEDLRAKIKSNEEALEKLRASTKNTTEEEQKLIKENEELNRALTENEKYLAAAEKGTNSWQTQLNNAKAYLNDLDTELKQNDALLDEASKSADGCAHSIDEFGNEVKESSEAIEKQNEALEALASALAAGGIVAGIEKITEALKACVTASADFEAGMSGVGAIANASAEEMDLLSEKAKQIGASTKYTAGEAAEALEYMALAGWSAEEMLQGVDGVIQLAAASGEDLATVSDIVTDALTAFGLEAEDSGHFVDVLAKTAASSNTTVTMLGEAFKYAAPLAGALGYSVEDVAVAMGLMANNGIKGSQAGTAMRTMFSKLAGDVKLSAQAFGDVTISAANADGTMKPFSQTLDELRFYFSQMTEAEKLANAEAVTGRYAMSGLTAIMNSTQDDFDSLTKAISECAGAAANMAETRMDNLTGQVTLLNSAFDALTIAVGDDLNPALRSLAESGTNIVTWAGDFINEHEEIVPIVAAVTTGLTAMVGSLSALTVGTKVVIPLIKAFGAALSASPIGLAATAVVTLTTALVTLAATLPDAQSEYEKLSAASKKQYDDLQALNAEYERACELYGENSEEAQKLAGEIAAGNALFEQQKTTIEEVSNRTSELIDRQASLRGQSSETARAFDTQRDSSAYLVDKLDALMSQEEKSVGTKQEVLTVVEMLNEAVPELGLAYDSYSDSLNMTAENIRKVIEAELERDKQAAGRDELKERMRNQQEMDAQLTEVRENLTAATERLTQVTEEMNTVLAEDTGEDSRAAVAATSEYITAVSAAKNEVESLTAQEQALSAAMEENEAEIQRLSSEYVEHSETVMEAASAEEQAAQNVASSLQLLAESYEEAYQAALESLDGQIGVWQEMDNETVKSSEDLQKAVDSQVTYLQNYADNMESLLSRNIDGIEDFARNFTDGSAESAAALAGLATASDEEIAQIIGSMALVSSSKEELAATFASLETDLTGNLTSIKDEFAATVQDISGKSGEVDFSAFETAVETAFSTIGAKFEEIGTDAGTGLETGIKSSSESKVAPAATAMGKAVLDAVRTALDSHSPSREMDQTGQDAGEGLAQGIEKSKDRVHSAAEELAQDIKDLMKTAGTDSAELFITEFSAIEAGIQASIESARAAVEELAPDINTSMESIGSQMIEGMINGLNNESGSLYDTVSDIVSQAIETAREEAGVHSPSWKTEKIFEHVGEGMAIGVEKKKKDVSEATKDVVKEALTIDTASLEAAAQLLTMRPPDMSSMLLPSLPSAPVQGYGDVNISVDMSNSVIREEADIRKISESLAQEIRVALRQKGSM